MNEHAVLNMIADAASEGQTLAVAAEATDRIDQVIAGPSGKGVGA